ncbi:hypothetical protein Pcinc_015917 [Petrolisthes cinctipes]|uniref:Secreted protein n=1 Tax=Petrolisthes cinctipes TaxID=88211 RepID=A0AAE1FTF6_PETCI|nr:hypothetical protein Pcinc_015917 [Petrolisthes cinctipes]
MRVGVVKLEPVRWWVRLGFWVVWVTLPPLPPPPPVGDRHPGPTAVLRQARAGFCVVGVSYTACQKYCEHGRVWAGVAGGDSAHPAGNK